MIDIGELTPHERPDASGDHHPLLRPHWSVLLFLVAAIGGGLLLAFILIRGDDDAQAVESTALDWHESGDVAPDWSPDGEWIVFTSDRDGDHDIWRIRPDGRGLQNLTPDSPARDSAPQWSPDGTRIAFRSERACDFCANLWVMDADGSQPVNVTANIPGARLDPYFFTYDWSPDSRYIALSRHNSLAPVADIWLVDVRGDLRPRRLSPDRRRASYFDDPSFSPDGRYIAFEGEDAVWIALRVGTITGQQPVVGLGNDALSVFGVAWSPVAHDELALVIAREDPLRTSVAVADPASWAQRILTPRHRTVRDFYGWSPDGEALLFSVPRGDAVDEPEQDLILQPAGGGAAINLTILYPGRHDEATFSPDGAQIAFVSDLDGRPHIWVMDSSGLNARNLSGRPRP
jgi:Tol biopolymer transport system component